MRLARIRKRAGLTQRELAGRIGIAQGTLAQVECGDRRLWPKLRRTLAEELNVPEEKLFR